MSSTAIADSDRDRRGGGLKPLPTAPVPTPLWRGVLPVAIAATFIARGLPYRHFVPIWDARIYADCLLEAVAKRAPALLQCADHPTIGYMAWLAAPMVAFGMTPAVIIVVNLVLGAAAVAAFHGILRRLFPDHDGEPERLLLTLALACHPVLLASALNLNPDYGVVVFYLLFLDALLAGRRALAALWGLSLVFSKEPGIALYGLTLAIHLPYEVGKRGASLRDWARALLRRWPLAIPVAAFVAYLAVKLSGPGGHLWGAHTGAGIFGILLSFRFDRWFFGYLFSIFLLSFQWVFAALGLVAILRWCGAGPDRSPRRSTIFALALLVAVTWFVTRYITFVNVRYVFAAVPLLLVAAYPAARTAIRSAVPRRAVLGATALLLLVSSYRTIDPVSRAYFGTFRFGRHDALAMTAPTKECCGLGRDQLVYNVESTYLDRLQNAIYRDLRPDRGAMLASHPLADWFLAGPLDAGQRRVLAWPPPPPVRILAPGDVLSKSPETVYYLAFPNFENGPHIALLSTAYDVASVREYEEDGYAIPVLEMRRR